MGHKMLEVKIRENIKKILKEKDLNQKSLALLIDKKESTISKLLDGTQRINLRYLEEIASALGLREIDVITYPDVYELPEKKEDGFDAILQIKLEGQQKHKVLDMVLGKKNVELLNK